MSNVIHIWIGLGFVIMILFTLYVFYKLIYSSSNISYNEGEEHSRGRKFTFMSLFGLPRYNVESRRRSNSNEYVEPLPLYTNTISGSQDAELAAIAVGGQGEEPPSYENSNQLSQQNYSSTRIE